MPRPGNRSGSAVRNSSRTVRNTLVRLAEMPASPPKKVRRISADEATSSATPSEIIANAVPLRLVETQPSRTANNSPVRPPTRGTSGSGIGSLLALMDVDGVDDEKAAEPVIDRMAERQHAGLAEQDVVGQREDDGDADQAEGGQCAAGREDASAAASAPRQWPPTGRRILVSR